MTRHSTVGARNARYVTDLVVALEHADLVAGELSAQGVQLGDVDRSALLGLARLPLHDVGSAAAALEGGSKERRGAARHGEARTDMDRFLVALRARFADQFAGWVPTMGKNRLVGQVIGGGKISHGGSTGPRATERRLGARASEPGRGARVGVLDTSIDAHPWCAGGWTAPAPAVLDGTNGPPRVVAGHATFVAGLVLSQAPGCTVEVRQVLSDEDGEADSWTVAQEIVALGQAGLDVLNLSFLCHTEDGRAPLVLAAAIDRLDPDLVVVAAAGNHGELPDDEGRKPAWPAALDHVVAVGAADSAGTRAPLSPAGAPWVDVLAPGVDVVSTFLSGPVNLAAAGQQDVMEEFAGYASWSGTSFAAALVSGAIAARTVPGHTPATDAWRDLRASATTTQQGTDLLRLDVLTEAVEGRAT